MQPRNLRRRHEARDSLTTDDEGDIVGLGRPPMGTGAQPTIVPPAEAEPEPEPEEIGETLDRDGSVPGTQTAEESVARLRAECDAFHQPAEAALQRPLGSESYTLKFEGTDQLVVPVYGLGWGPTRKCDDCKKVKHRYPVGHNFSNRQWQKQDLGKGMSRCCFCIDELEKGRDAVVKIQWAKDERHALKHVGNTVKDDPQIVLAAVKRNWHQEPASDGRCGEYVPD